MKEIFNLMLRIIDTAGLWVIFADGVTQEKRFQVFLLLFVLMLLLNLTFVFYLNIVGELEIVYIIKILMHIIINSVVLAFLTQNKNKRANDISSIRKIFLIWFAFLVMYEQLMDTFFSVLEGVRNKSTKDKYPSFLADAIGD